MWLELSEQRGVGRLVIKGGGGGMFLDHIKPYRPWQELWVLFSVQWRAMEGLGPCNDMI